MVELNYVTDSALAVALNDLRLPRDLCRLSEKEPQVLIKVHSLCCDVGTQTQRLGLIYV